MSINPSKDHPRMKAGMVATILLQKRFLLQKPFVEFLAQAFAEVGPEDAVRLQTFVAMGRRQIAFDLYL